MRLHDGQWGASAELGVVKHLRFEDTGMTAGQKVCLETTDDKPADPAFGTRIYLNASGKRTASEPEKPLYVDGVLSRLPEATDVRLNDEGSAADASKPWLWLNTKTCGATAAPGREGKPGPADLDFTALVKAGDVKAQTVMTSDPLGKAPLALAKPDATTPLGANVHALVDGIDKLAGFDVAAHLKVPEHTVVYRPVFQACDEGAPLACQDLPAWTRRERLDAGLRVMSTGTSWGSVDALVRMRSLLPVDNAPGPQAPNVCATNADDGRSVCDLDVIAHLASVPAKFLVQGQLATNARQPDAGLTFKVQNLAADPSPYPKWDTATARVTDEAHPSATGVRTTSAGTPVDLYRVNLKGIAHELTAKVRFQGNETLPPNANVCPTHSYAGRGPDGRRLRRRRPRRRRRHERHRQRPHRRVRPLLRQRHLAERPERHGPLEDRERRGGREVRAGADVQHERRRRLRRSRPAVRGEAHEHEGRPDQHRQDHLGHAGPGRPTRRRR